MYARTLPVSPWTSANLLKFCDGNEPWSIRCARWDGEEEEPEQHQSLRRAGRRASDLMSTGERARPSLRACEHVPTALVPRYSTVTMEWAGVGMILEPSSDPGNEYCHVSSMKDGGALANDGRVKPGDKLVRVDGFDCMGVPRAVIKSRVLGPPNSEVVLEFQRDRGVFKVTLRRQAQLLSSNVRNRVSGSATRQAENGDREPCLEKSALSHSCKVFTLAVSRELERVKTTCRKSP